MKNVNERRTCVFLFALNPNVKKFSAKSFFTQKLGTTTKILLEQQEKNVQQMNLARLNLTLNSHIFSSFVFFRSLIFCAELFASHRLLCLAIFIVTKSWFQYSFALINDVHIFIEFGFRSFWIRVDDCSMDMNAFQQI